MAHVHDAPVRRVSPPAVAGSTFDPVCGMAVPRGMAAGEVLHEGAIYRFCSQHCLSAFKADPEKYAVRVLAGVRPTEETATASEAPRSVVYTCPMHPQVRQLGPGT